MIIGVLASALISAFIVIVIQSFAWLLTRRLVSSWTWLYTLSAPRGDRDERRLQMESDLFEQRADYRNQGYTLETTAFHIICRSIAGMKDDIAWSLSYLSTPLAERLILGSENLKRGRHVRVMALTIVALITLNLAWLVSEENTTWIRWLPYSAASVVFIVLVVNQRHPWVRRTLNGWITLGIGTAFNATVHEIVGHRLYELPNSNQMMVVVAVATLPIAVWVVTRNEAFRVRLFKNRSWPTFALTFCSILVALGLSSFMGLAATPFASWMLMGGLIVILGIFAGFSLAGASAIWYIGMRSGAVAKGLVAARIRRDM